MEQLNKETFLASIKPDMVLTKGFIKKIYGYGVTDVSFPNRVIAALETAGCSKARQYYESWVSEYEAAQDAELREVAHWYIAECEREWERKQKEGEEKRKGEQKPEWKSSEQRWAELSIILGFQ